MPGGRAEFIRASYRKLSQGDVGDIVKRISIVVPVYNEEENIAHFAAAVEEVMGRLPYDYELLFIDDGSTDRSHRSSRSMSPAMLRKSCSL